MMVLHFIIGLLTGVLSGFGIGGGTLLIIFLTTFTSINQYEAGGINLLYFICCAPTALVSHIKNKLIDKKAVIFCSLAGIFTSVAASVLSHGMDTDLLRRLFGILLLYVGIKELFFEGIKKQK